MLKLAGVVIFYHPDKSKTIENIVSYANQLNKLYIFDNSEPSSIEVQKDLANLKIPFEYITTGTNEGISKRLNEAADKAIQEGFDFLLTMDQDSSFDSGVFDQYLRLVDDYDKEKVAQFGVNCDPKHIPISDIPFNADSLITSGTILNLAVFQKVGKFDEKLFIDFVDVEYSLRASYMGYQNIIFSNVIMKHALGYLKLGRSFKNFKKTLRILHSPIRVYYIIRNGLYLLFKVNHIDKKARKAILFDHMKMLKNDFLYNDHLGAVYVNAAQGVNDFLFNKMGKKIE
jgi:rhamnosyltransferase